MNRRLALKIIGIDESYTLDELKKKYRALMLVAHPDSNTDNSYEYEASEINSAYEFLTENINSYKSSESENSQVKIKWNAPVNENAYSDREIFHNIDDFDGNVLGKAVIDMGKYEWIEDEEFSLFILSLYNCSKNIIAEDDAKRGLNRIEDITLQSKITYLLAQQFVNKEIILGVAAKKISDSNDLIYQFDAMLECAGSKRLLKKGEYLIPSGIKDHKLYVKSVLGENLGYISFKDDRLYYGVIPLLERKAAQVKMEIFDPEIKRHNGKRYINVDMKIKLLPEDKNHMLESINLEIDNVLQN